MARRDATRRYAALSGAREEEEGEENRREVGRTERARRSFGSRRSGNGSRHGGRRLAGRVGVRESARARAREGGGGVRAAGRNRASLPSARSARYAISLTGHVCVTLTFTLVPFGVLRCRAGGVATAAVVTVRCRVKCAVPRKVLLHTRCAAPRKLKVLARSILVSRARTSKQCSRGRRSGASKYAAECRDLSFRSLPRVVVVSLASTSNDAGITSSPLRK